MSILIPKMIMPETCGDCPFFMDEDFTWCGRANYNICDGKVDRYSKPKWCDLIEVPNPNINADELIVGYQVMKKKDGVKYTFQENGLIRMTEVENVDNN